MTLSLGPSGITSTSRNTPLFSSPQQVFSNSSFALTTSAQKIFGQRTSVNGADAVLSTGPHLLQMYVSNNPFYSMNYTAVVQWYGSETNSSGYVDVPLNYAGHANNNAQVYCRIRMQGRNTNTDLQCQVWASGNYTVNMTAWMTRLI
jgi:hypothetical protein